MAQLSVARSDLGAAAAGGAAVFGGGCAKGSSEGPVLGGGCVGPSAAVDILRPAAAQHSATPRGTMWEHAPESAGAALSEARGWPATCGFAGGQGPPGAGDTVAFLGGATPRAGSTTLDLLSVTTGAVVSNKSALPWLQGRWGTSCAPAADGSQLVFGGGKIYPHMTDEVLVLPAGEPAAMAHGLAKAAWALGEAREDSGAVGWGPDGALFAGGWVSNTEPGHPSAAVDTLLFDPTAGGHFAWEAGLAPPAPNQEWVGAAAWNQTTVFLADAHSLYEVSGTAQATGRAPPTRRALPSFLATGAIPAARLQQNGVRVQQAVCFYAATPVPALVCWSPPTSSWGVFNCTAGHVAGGITAVGQSVLVGGGYDGTTLTNAVDVFTFP